MIFNRKTKKNPRVKPQAKTNTKALDKVQDEALVQTFLDMIAPNIVKFEPDYFICGNTFRCCWALREYPTSTTQQAILQHLGKKAGVTLHIYTRVVTPAEERKIINLADKKNRMERGTKVKRGKYYSVVYTYTNEKGEEQQKWESNKYTSKQADERIKEIEWDLKNGTFIAPSEMNVRQLFEKVVAVYGANNWQPGTYESNLGLIENHINPHIGERPIQKVMPLEIEEMFNKLKKEKVQRGKGNDRPVLSSTTLSLIYTVLKLGFDLGVKWKMLKETPVVMEKPKRSTTEASIWEKETFYYALADMKHSQLHLAVHLAFSCTLRVGETVGLTWECVDFDRNRIYIKKTMQRVQKATLEVVSKEDIYLEFPNVVEDKKSTLILKKPKTKSSIRTIEMTGPIRHELLMRKQFIAKQKAYHGKDYKDYDLIFCMDDGRPVEPHLCEKWFNKWQKRTEGEFPKIKFHEIRHSSATYKMELSNGNPRQVADHSGHAKLDVLFGTYVHSKKDSGRELTEKFERDFYSIGGAVQIAAKKEEDTKDTLLRMLREDPSLRDVVKQALDASNAEDASDAKLAKN